MEKPTDDLVPYAAAAARLNSLSIDPAYQAGVVENLERIEVLARLVLEFPMPDGVEPAPRFEP